MLSLGEFLEVGVLVSIMFQVFPQFFSLLDEVAVELVIDIIEHSFYWWELMFLAAVQRLDDFLVCLLP